MSTTAPEYLTTLRTGLAEAVQQWADQSTSAWEQWTRAWQPVADAGADALGMPRVDPGSPPRVARRPDTRATGPGHHHEGRHEHEGHHHEGCGCGGHHDHEGHEGHHEHHHLHGEHYHGHHDGCGCGERPHGGGCGCGGRAHGHGRCADDCCADACDCCVPDADVVVRARAGEVRVVPFRLHNPWRREREVTLEVGPWHPCGGDDLDVRARLEETSLTLAPCEDRVVRLLVTATGTRGGDTGDQRPLPDDPAKDRASQKEAAKDEAGREKPARATRQVETEAVEQVSVLRGGDVDSCSSAYADVRFEGCARPQRVALVVLPAECDPVDLGCGCGCCCEGHR